MKTKYTHIIWYVIISLISAAGIKAEEIKTNVLSYYAITNQLDGQPMIDMNNVLRFYPVFSFRDKTFEVHITIYKNGSRYHVPAIANEDKSFWEIKLPPFELGEAVQRIEVEARVETWESYRNALTEYKQSLLMEMKNSGECCKSDTCDKERCMEQLEMLRRINDLITVGSILSRIETNFAEHIPESDEYQMLMDSLYRSRCTGIIKEKEIPELHKITQLSVALQNDLSIIDNLMNFAIRHFDCSEISRFEDIKKDVLISYNVDTKTEIILQYSNAISYFWFQNLKYNEIPAAVTKYLVKSFSDTSSVGTPIRPGDIILDQGGTHASLLYRNYKRGVRYLTALDPAERLGIFRLRYIPFAIIGKELVKPVGDNPTGIFEVGMSFGDPIVSGDDFTVPPFAPERLGVAFAISNEFFSDSARVAALALTYDFNSYGSIAVGSNFNTKEKKIQSYLSFGINKKAFEGLVKAIKNLFN